jgi:hypothetical protein
MPLFGALELGLAAPRLPTLRDLDTETWTLPGAEILQLAFEVPRATHALLPRAMHPAIPPYVTLHVTRYPESPAGPSARWRARPRRPPRSASAGACPPPPAR